MDKLLESFISQAPTIAVLLWIFSQLRVDVMTLIQLVFRLLEKCMDDADNDGSNVKNTPV